jgi:hypothetical protein
LFTAGTISLCIPLQSIIDSTGLLDINLFSLDVEGAEYAVLTTIDWSVTNFEVIVVELDAGNPTKDQQVRDLLERNGYQNAALRYGSIRDACVPGGDCTLNEVYLNPMFHIRKSERRFEMQNHTQKLLFRDSGVPC